MSHILDISRLVSRAHLPFDTGIDRVERAFVLDSLDRFEAPLFIARIGKRFVVLDADRMRRFLIHEKQQDWMRASRMDVFRFKLSPDQRRVRTTLRKQALGISDLTGLADMIGSVAPDGFDYMNVGHSNLGNGFLSVIKASGGKNMTAFVHDMIPLDYPKYCREDRIEPFTNNMKNIAKMFDRVICNSQYTADRVQHWFQTFGTLPEVVVSHLGSPILNPENITPKRHTLGHSFVVLGTIEPRKNISFLLDVWDRFAEQRNGEDMPRLIVIGKRGWEEPAVFDRLDKAVRKGYVMEFNDFSDVEIYETLMGTQALLFPSHVEGYGLPAQEALALGVPVVASEIPVFQELFNDSAKLLPIDNVDVWVENLNVYLRQKPVQSERYSKDINLFKTVTWPSFFDRVYKNNQQE